VEVIIDFLGGNCPVQADGTIDGVPFYFRARGQQWSIGIGSHPLDAPTWYHRELWGDDPYGAGWMSREEAEHLIHVCAKWYNESQEQQYAAVSF
jgi:hypothetical protein